MTRLYVVPHDVMAMMHDAQIPIRAVCDLSLMVQHLSVNDMMDIYLAMQQFPFQFCEELDLRVGLNPYELLMVDGNVHPTVYNRLKERVDTQALQPQEETGVPSYTLNPVDENVWVAVVQRHHTEEGDPGRQLLSANQSFFDGLIANVLHTLSFEKLCTTNLFTHYLGSLTPTTVSG